MTPGPSPRTWRNGGFLLRCWLPGDLDYVGAPVVGGILVRGRRDVLGGQPDARAVRIGDGEGVVAPPGLVERGRVREAHVRARSCSHRRDPARPQRGVGGARVDGAAGDV